MRLESGPTLVKLGQILATRVDLFAPEWIAEFSKLEDCVPVVPYSAILQQLTEDLGAPSRRDIRLIRSGTSGSRIHRLGIPGSP